MQKHHYEFVLGTLTAVNKDKKIIDLISPQVSKEQNTHIQQLSYDTLVFSAWFQYQMISIHPVFAKTCHFLDSRKQADIFPARSFTFIYRSAKINPINVH